MSNKTKALERLMCAARLRCGLIAHSEAEANLLRALAADHGLKPPRIKIRELND